MQVGQFYVETKSNPLPIVLWHDTLLSMHVYMPVVGIMRLGWELSS